MWIDESQTVQSNLDRGRPATAMAAKEEEDPLGILDEGDKYAFIYLFKFFFFVAS